MDEPGEATDVGAARVVEELELRRREAEAARAAAEGALARLAESEERFRMLAERTSDVIVRYDRDGVIEYASPSAKVWGYAPHEMVGRNMADFCHPEEQARLMAVRTGVTRGGPAPARTPFRVRTADGGWRWAEGNPATLYDKTGAPVAAVTVIRDVTDRLEIEAQLRRSREEAEAANEAKTSFLATMTHEIRTPLNGVLGMVQAMAADELTPAQRKRLEVIRTSGQQLLALLNDVLDISKIEAGKLVLEKIAFDIGELCAGVTASFAAVAEARGLSLEARIEADAAGRYLGDPTRLRQILSNLVSNALKFTEQGGVEVRVEANARGLVIAVRDTGVGIAPERLERLFEKFEQEDSSTARRFGGTGLGLAICRELAERMGGTIDAASRAGEGATFTLELPLERAAAAADAMAQPEPDAGGAVDASLKLLVAEDNEVNRLVLKTLLAQAGLAPKLVGDGAAAVAAWRAEPFDLILMDVQMPTMDGVTATRAIRRLETELGRPRTPIVALTANAMAHQTAEYEAAGMDGHVPKPIEISRLFATIAQVLAPPDAERATA